MRIFLVLSKHTLGYCCKNPKIRLSHGEAQRSSPAQVSVCLSLDTNLAGLEQQIFEFLFVRTCVSIVALVTAPGEEKCTKKFDLEGAIGDTVNKKKRVPDK